MLCCQLIFTDHCDQLIKVAMKIGIFDSGLGGLHIAKSIQQHMPEYDYIYLGDTLHVPYGRRSVDTIYELTRKAIDYLFRQDCALIIVACNTASALALRKIQQDYLVNSYPDRRVLGVIVPTLEHTIASGSQKIGLLATEAMAASGIYEEELTKINPKIQLYTQAAPLLVPMLEHDGEAFFEQALQRYLEPLSEKGIDSLILGCTHYCLLKDRMADLLGPTTNIISQDEIIPLKLRAYLQSHAEIDGILSKKSSHKFCVTDISPSFLSAAQNILGRRDVSLRKADLYI
jgi:glutamate racemase